MPIQLSVKDQKLVEQARRAIKRAYESAHMPAGVAKRMASYAMYYRNKGRRKAIKNHPFKNICEASGRFLASEDK